MASKKQTDRKRSAENAELLELIATLEAELQPCGPLEDFLIWEMACAQLRLARRRPLPIADPVSLDELAALQGYEDAARNAFYQALDKLLELRFRDSTPPPAKTRRAPIPWPESLSQAAHRRLGSGVKSGTSHEYPDLSACGGSGRSHSRLVVLPL
jgi:hypothetical protein